MSMHSSAAYKCGPFALLRTALFPFPEEALHGEVDQKPVESNGAASGETVRARALLGDPLFREALIVASGDLHAALTRIEQDPSTVWTPELERAIVRYSARMQGRATPYGLCAAVSVLKCQESGDGIRLLQPRVIRRHARIDSGALVELAEALWPRLPPSHQRVSRNPTLHRMRGKWRYVRTSVLPTGFLHELTELADSDLLARALDLASDSGSVQEVAQELVGADVTGDEATFFGNVPKAVEK